MKLCLLTDLATLPFFAKLTASFLISGKDSRKSYLKIYKNNFFSRKGHCTNCLQIRQQLLSDPGFGHIQSFPMYKVFHQLAGNIYNASDIEHCLKFAEAIRTQYPQMVFTIYIVSNNQLNTLIGVTGLTVSGNTFTYGNISGVIETERTYSKKNQPETVLAICILEEKSLVKIQSSPTIKCMFVVPEMPGYLDHWLQLHSADDITTNPIQPFHGIPTCPQELKRAIGYLKDYTRRLDVDLTHTSIQKGVLQAAFNAYRANAPKVTFDQIYAEALRRDLSHVEAEILAKTFSRTTAFSGATVTNWDAINDQNWENN